MGHHNGSWAGRTILTILLLLASAAPATRAALDPLREISYYPRDYAWLAFWPNWPQASVQMDADLDDIAALGANTVRIFVHPSAFGYPEPDPLYLGYLAEALDLIGAHDLEAHVNLFDCWWSWEDVAGSQDWLGSLFASLPPDPPIALWELQNEVPLDLQNAQGDLIVRNWVRALFPYLKALAGATPCTVSVNEVEWLDDIIALTAPSTPDIYSLHWYPGSIASWTDALPSALGQARTLVGDTPLLLGEFGQPSGDLSDEVTDALSDASQASLYRDVLYHAHRQGIVHLGAWTYTDFAADTVICGAESASCAERHFGLVRLDGSPKPARDVLRDAFHDVFPSSPAPPELLNASFEQANPYCGQVENWWPWDPGWSRQDTFVQDCTTAHTGQCSVRVQATFTDTVGLFHVPAFPARPGWRCALHGYVRTQNLDGSAQIVLSWLDAGGYWVKNSPSQVITDANLLQWTQISVESALPPARAAYAQAFAQIHASSPASIVWFDDFALACACEAHLPLVVAEQ